MKITPTNKDECQSIFCSECVYDNPLRMFIDCPYRTTFFQQGKSYIIH